MRKWSLNVLVDESLTGDRILLPESMLAEMMSTLNETQLTSTFPDIQFKTPIYVPERSSFNNNSKNSDKSILTFKLTNEINKSTTHATGFQFTASPNTVIISPYIFSVLFQQEIDKHGIKVSSFQENNGPTTTTTEILSSSAPGTNPSQHAVHEMNATNNQSVSSEVSMVTLERVHLPKGVFAKLSPMEASYMKIQNIRALLESYLRKNHSTLTRGEILTIIYTDPETLGKQANHFMISELKPADAVICVNTDIEVDIVPIDDDIAKEAVMRKFTASPSQEILIWKQELNTASTENFRTILADTYQHFKLKVRPEMKNYHIKLTLDSGDADLFVSLKEQVSIMNHDYFNVDKGGCEIQFSLDTLESQSTPLRRPEYLFIAVRGYEQESFYKLDVSSSTLTTQDNEITLDQAGSTANHENIPYNSNQDNNQCANCGMLVPSRTFEMHRAFCERNNVKCLLCNIVYPRTTFDRHWHCENCSRYGDVSMKEKHMKMYHKLINCDCESEFELYNIGKHKRQDCPERMIICRFCHLLVKAGPPSTSGKDLILGSNLSEHESECGARTIQCSKCQKNIQLKDVQVHMLIHSKLNEPSKIVPPIYLCSNCQCSRPQNMASRNKFNMCQFCFAPFWSPRIDEGNQKFIRKLTDTYQKQLMNGCNREFCKNMHCATFNKQKLKQQDAYEKARELVNLHFLQYSDNPMFFICINSPSVVNRRTIAEKLTDLGFSLEWCIKGLMETEDDENQAAAWLLSNAPTQS